MWKPFIQIFKKFLTYERCPSRKPSFYNHCWVLSFHFERLLFPLDLLEMVFKMLAFFLLDFLFHPHTFLPPPHCYKVIFIHCSDLENVDAHVLVYSVKNTVSFCHCSESQNLGFRSMITLSSLKGGIFIID